MHNKTNRIVHNNYTVVITDDVMMKICFEFNLN